MWMYEHERIYVIGTEVKPDELRPWLASIRKPLTSKVRKEIQKRKKALGVELVKVTVSESTGKRQVWGPQLIR